jgi:hypothetical protein
LLKLYDSKDVMKTDSPYQVIQFISWLMKNIFIKWLTLEFMLS